MIYGKKYQKIIPVIQNQLFVFCLLLQRHFYAMQGFHYASAKLNYRNRLKTAPDISQLSNVKCNEEHNCILFIYVIL